MIRCDNLPPGKMCCLVRPGAPCEQGWVCFGSSLSNPSRECSKPEVPAPNNSCEAMTNWETANTEPAPPRGGRVECAFFERLQVRSGRWISSGAATDVSAVV